MHHLPSTIIARVTMLLIASACCLQAADPFWQTFHLNDGTQVDGIPVRKTTARFTIATAEEVVVLHVREIRIRGAVPAAAVAADNLLTIIENGIAQSDYQRAATNVADAKRAVAGFATAIDSLARHGTPEQKQAAANALGFYNTLLEQYPLTIATLKLAKDVRTLEGATVSGRRVTSADLLREFIALDRQLRALPADLPLAAKQRADAAKTIADRITQLTNALAAEAIRKYDERNTLNDLNQLFRALAAGAELSDGYSNAQLQALRDLPDVVRKRLSTLLPAADAILGAGDNFDEAQRDYNNLAATRRADAAALRELKSLLFGQAANQSNEVVDSILAQIERALADAGARRELILEVRGTYRDAELALTRENFAKAGDLFRRADTLIRTNKLPGNALLASIRLGLLRTRAYSQLENLRNAHQLDAAAAVDLLARQATQFLAATRRQLEPTNFPINVFENLLAKTKSYHQFRLRLEAVAASAADNSPKLWSEVAAVNDWLDRNKANTFPEAADQWQQLQETTIRPQLLSLRSDFLAGGALPAKFTPSLFPAILAISNLDDRRRIILAACARPTRELSDKLLGAEIAKLIADLRRSSPTAAPPFLAELARTTRGAKLDVVTNLNANNLLAEARRHVAANNPSAAITAFASVIKEFPDFATQANVADEAADAIATPYRQNLPAAVDEALPSLEKLCAALPNHDFASTLRPFSNAILERLTTHWNNAKFTDAIDQFGEFETNYPNFVSNLKIDRQFFQLVAREASATRKAAFEADATVPRPLQQALEDLIAAHPDVPATNNLRSILVMIRMDLAARYLESRQVLSARKIYADLIDDYPEEAEQYRVQAVLDRITLRYRLAQIQAPFNIEDTQDNLAFFLVVLLWPLLLSRAFYDGRTRGHLRYRLVHWLAVFTVFAVLCAIFVFGKVKFTNAVAFAFLPPFLLFNAAGTTTYMFFPLIYHERRHYVLSLLIVVLDFKLGTFSLASLPPLGAIRQRLGAMHARTQEDLPLLHDRWLLRIDKVVRLGYTDPQAAYKQMQSLRSAIKQELIKDEMWQQRLRSCMYHNGVLAAKIGNRQDALESLQEFAALNPDHVPSRLLIAELHLTDHRYQEALEHVRAAAKLDDSDDVLYQLGYCAFKTGENQLAAQTFERIGQRNRDVLFYGARAHTRCGDYARAAKWFETLLRSDRHDHEAIYYLACALAQHGEDQKALKTSAVIPADSSFHADALALQGSIFIRLNRYENAEEQFVRAMQASPKSIPALLGYAQLLIETERLQHAAKLVDSALQQQPNNPAANYYMGFLVEAKDASKAVLHYNRALRDPRFKRVTESRLAHVYFFRREFPMAIRHFQSAEECGQLTPWFQYLYAYSLAAVGNVTECAAKLTALLDTNFDDPDWADRAGSALYAIGIRLAKHGALQMAIQAIELAEVHLENPLQLEALHDQLDELRFQLALNLLLEDNPAGARSLLENIFSGPVSPERQLAAQFYRGLAALRDGDPAAALVDFNDVCHLSPDNPRYQYHAMVAKLSLGQDQEARTDFAALLKRKDLPPAVVAGFETVKAHLKARQGDYAAAIKILAPVAHKKPNYPGGDAVRIAAVGAWLILLAKTRDHAAMETAAKQLSGESGRHAALVRAIALASDNRPDAARDALLPIADSPIARDALITICTHLAKRAVAAGDPGEATKQLALIPEPPDAVASARASLDLSLNLVETNAPDDLRRTLDNLNDHARDLSDTTLRGILVHNLGVYLYRYAAALEATGDSERIDTAWDDCLSFWLAEIIPNDDHWQREAHRFAESPDDAFRFSRDELTAIRRGIADRLFLIAFIEYVITALRAGDEVTVQRHLRLARRMAEELDLARGWFASIAKAINTNLNDIDKDDPIRDSWDFHIARATAKQELQNLFAGDATDGGDEARLLRECRHRYDNPKEYQKAKREFNTSLLGALQQGAMGAFTPAGNDLGKVIADVPPGMLSQKVIGKLRVLREACRNPEESINNGIDLPKEFEKHYANVRELAQAGSRTQTIKIAEDPK